MTYSEDPIQPGDTRKRSFIVGLILTIITAIAGPAAYGYFADSITNIQLNVLAFIFAVFVAAAIPSDHGYGFGSRMIFGVLAGVLGLCAMWGAWIYAFEGQDGLIAHVNAGPEHIWSYLNGIADNTSYNVGGRGSESTWGPEWIKPIWQVQSATLLGLPLILGLYNFRKNQ